MSATDLTSSPATPRATPPAHRHVFVGGLHRSGTTPLAKWLAEHPQISGLTGTGVPEDEGQHVQRVYPPAARFGGPGTFAFSPEAHMTETSPLATPASRERLDAAWGAHWERARPVLLEKSPPNLVRTRFLQALYPEASFVVITRHPGAVAMATRKWAGPLRNVRVHTLVRHWFVAHECFLRDSAHLRRVLLVRYEDLVSAPGRELARVHRFLGVDEVPVDVPARGRLNADYFAEWRSNPLQQLYTGAIARRMEPRARAFGYSLLDWDAAPPPTRPVAALRAGRPEVA
ncbi:MAG: sulfotransferase [Solirubrobacteraceae bacterium]|nr:sulfotransferase [Solirubrobacteraceae bacterium]